ncbi:MAG: helicase HerA-like domain-containing protein [Solirubrobacteraceae bacterium]
MPSTPPYTTEPPVNPLEPLADLLGWLGSTTVHIVIGLLAGAVATHLMRRRHLRWTWAGLFFVPLLLIHSKPSGWVLTCDTATVCAAVRGRRWHREDLLAGGDLADTAAARRGPLEAMRVLVGVLRQRVAPVSHAAMYGESISVGRTKNYEQVSIPFGVCGGGKHSLIVGATGSGKTVTETWIATRAIDAGLAAVVVDPKGDARMREQLAMAADRNGRRFLEWTPRGPSVYNPFNHGAASGVADKALAGELFTEPHYQRQAQRYLGHAVRALRGAGEQVSLRALVDSLDPTNLEALCSTVPEHQARATHDYLNSLTRRARGELGGVRDRLAIMVESDVGPWLDPATPGAPVFDLLETIRERAVVYFSLEVDAWRLLAQMLGVAIVQDLQATMAALQAEPIPAVVVIDEFASIAAEQIGHLFGRARSAGINLLLGTQELSDLRVKDRRELLEQVLGNLSCLLAHRQVVPESAELIARLGGSRGAWRTSRSDAGHWTRSRSSRPRLSVEEIRGLKPGWAAALDLAGGGDPQIMQVFSSLAPATSESLPSRLRSRLAAVIAPA